MYLLRPNVLANLRQVSGAVRANANMNHRARTVTDTARRQVQRFVRPHLARNLRLLFMTPDVMAR